MYQLITVITCFLLMPLLGKFKLKLSYSLFITATLLGVVSGVGIKATGESFINVFIDYSSRNTLLTVMAVSLLSGLMKYYEFLDKIVDTILLLIKNKKNILMIVPAIIGILVIPGGALLSAPFINDIGQDMNIPPPRRAAINVVFRHMALYLLPYSTGLLIITATLPQINIFKLIFFNLLYVVLTVTAGYFLYIKDIESEVSIKRKNIGLNIYKLVIFTSPIYVCVILNAITGLPFFITIIVSILIVYLLSNKKNFLKVLYKSLNWDAVKTIIAVLFLKEIILNMDGLFSLFYNIFVQSSNMLYIFVVFMMSSIILGLITGNQSVALAIIIPMISQLDLSIKDTYLYTYFAFGSSFLGYFFSPIHLCQAFTLQVMNVQLKDLYKEYKFYAIATLAILFGTVFIYYLLNIL